MPLTVNLDNSTTAYDSVGTNPYNATHVAGSTASYGTVRVGLEASSQSITGVSWDGVEMDLLGFARYSSGNGAKVYIYGIQNPATGSKTIAVRMSSGRKKAVMVNSWGNVDSTFPIGASASISGSASVISLPLTSSNGDVCIDCYSQTVSSTPVSGYFTVDYLQTVVSQICGTQHTWYVSPNMSWSGESSVNYSILGIPLRGSSANDTVPPGLIILDLKFFTYTYPYLSVLDDFNRGSLGSNWQLHTNKGMLGISANQLALTGNQGWDIISYTGSGLNWQPDQWAQVTSIYHSRVGGGYDEPGLALRCSDSGCYWFAWTDINYYIGFHSQFYADYTLKYTGTTAVPLSAVLKFQISGTGTATNLTAYMNGITLTSISAGNWPITGWANTGSPGISSYLNTNVLTGFQDNWSAGDIVY